MPQTNAPSITQPSQAATTHNRQSAASNGQPPAAETTGSPAPWRLMTKADVCAVYGVSVRCLEYWIQEGKVPAPTHIGGRRFWHPESFYRDLAASMGVDQLTAGTPDEASIASAAGVSAKKAAKKPTKVAEPHPAATRLAARQAARLESMNRRLAALEG